MGIPKRSVGAGRFAYICWMLNMSVNEEWIARLGDIVVCALLAC